MTTLLQKCLIKIQNMLLVILIYYWLLTYLFHAIIKCYIEP